MNGFLNLLKPPGMSSHDAVNAVRKILGEKKVGHAGTLDPAAAGVLPLGVGRAAKFLEYLFLADKEYRAEIIFGLATDTGDYTGEHIDKREEFNFPGEGELKKAFAEFTGKIRQRPPAYSAVKLKGVPAYKLARQKDDIDIPEREVEVRKLELLSVRKTENIAFFRAEVSKGTYIRSLCADIGRFFHLPATMGFLLRTRVGDFRLQSACTLEELVRLKEEALQPPENFFTHIKAYNLPAHRVTPFKNGLPTTEKRLILPELVAVFGQSKDSAAGESKFLGLGRYDRNKKLVFPEKIYDVT